MNKELTISKKKEWAQMLYISDQFTQKQIAVKVGISETSLSKWVTTEKWSALKTSMLTTKNEILRNLYDVLGKINRKLKEDDSIGDAKTADMYVKYTASIKNLETETNIGEITEVGRLFINWLQLLDPQLSLEVCNHFDKFVKERLKRF